SRSNRHPPRPTTETTLRLPLIGPTSDNELKTRPCSRRRAIPDGQSAPNRLLQYRALRVALAPAELVGVAQPGRARRREEPSLEAQARFLKRQLSLPVSPTQISHQTERAPSMRAFSPPDAPTRFAEDQAGAASLLPREEGNLRVAELAESAVELNAWATEEGLRGATARELFDGYCQRLSASGFVLMRAYVSTQTHPQWSGYGYTWRRELNSVREQQSARGPVSQEWLSSPFHALIRRSRAGEKNPWLRRRLELGPEQRDFPALAD